MQPKLLSLAAAAICVLAASTAQASGQGTTLRDLLEYQTATQLGNRFLGCVDQAANADGEPAAVAAAQACFGSLVTDDFTITIDGVAGSRLFPDAQSFIAFATGPADLIRINVSLIPGVYTVLDSSGRRRDRSITIFNLLDIVQTVTDPNPVFGSILGGQQVRGRIDFTVREVSRNQWRIVSSRFTVLDLESGLDIQSLPRREDLQP